MKKLLIISHTEHYYLGETIVGWGATVREINHLAKKFCKIYHLAVLLDEKAPSSALPYTAPNIEFIALKPSGGKSLQSKMSVLTQAPATLVKVNQLLKKVDYFQLRTPTGIANYLIPYLSFFTKKKGWYKYAGNWIQANKPLGYAWQQFALVKLQKRKVTINGNWPKQDAHLLSFENPCLTSQERQEGKVTIQNKNKSKPTKINICFVGVLKDSKGVHRIISALTQFSHPQLGTMHFVGDGPKRPVYEAKAQKMNCPAVFHGFLAKYDVNEVLKKCQIFLLPTDSEGFPKVVAEAANYGCIPIVSDVSSIGQYIKEGENGYLLQKLTTECIVEKLRIVFKELALLPKYRNACWKMGEKFTYDNYNRRIITDLL